MEISNFVVIVCLSAFALRASPAFSEEAGRYLTEAEMEASILKVREEFSLRDAVLKEKKSRWLARVALPYPKEECIAFLRNGGACLLTAGEYNLSLNPDDSVSLLDSTSDTSKDDLLKVRKTFLDRFSATLRGRAMLQDTNDAEVGKAADRAWCASLAEEEKALGTAKLKGLYRKYYDACFAPRRRMSLALMGASDSAFLDSLVEATENPPMQAPGNTRLAGKTGGAGTGRVFTWEAVALEDLPPEISSPLRVVKPGENPPLIRTPYGWFAARIPSNVQSPAVSYEDALPILLALASMRPEFLHTLESRSAGESEKRAGNPDPDIRCWLMPPSRLPGRSFSMPKWADTARVRPMEYRLSLLPDLVSQGLSGILSGNGSGIRKNRLGVWYLQVQPNRHASEKPGPEAPDDGTRRRLLQKRGEAAVLRGVHQAAIQEAADRERNFKIEYLLSRNLGGSPSEAFAGVDKAGMDKGWVETNVDFEPGLLRP